MLGVVCVSPWEQVYMVTSPCPVNHLSPTLHPGSRNWSPTHKCAVRKPALWGPLLRRPGPSERNSPGESLPSFPGCSCNALSPRLSAGSSGLSPLCQPCFLPGHVLFRSFSLRHLTALLPLCWSHPKNCKTRRDHTGSEDTKST